MVAKSSKQHDSQILARRALQVQRGAARAAVLGVNDGLVSVLCIVLAVAAAGASQSSVLLAGFAGLIAGAISMAAGEWISVKSQVELFDGILRDLRHIIKHHDEGLLSKRVADSLEGSGYKPASAKKAATEISHSEEHLTTVYARQVLGFNPDELGSPWVAAISSLALFTLGALAPLAAWFFIGGMTAIWWSIGLTALGSLIVGGYIGNSSDRTIVYGATRQLIIVALASVVTYGIGHLFGVAVN